MSYSAQAVIRNLSLLYQSLKYITLYNITEAMFVIVLCHRTTIETSILSRFTSFKTKYLNHKILAIYGTNYDLHKKYGIYPF